MTLTEFLLARIAEDEAVANAAAEAFTRGVSTPPTWASKRQWERFDPAVSEQIRRHDPASVLAECAALREVVGLHTACDDVSYGDTSTCPTLRALAKPYADHPDYRPEEWA